jgi:hypothetical protein
MAVPKIDYMRCRHKYPISSTFSIVTHKIFRFPELGRTPKGACTHHIEELDIRLVYIEDSYDDIEGCAVRGL